VSAYEIPVTGSAEVHVLNDGHVGTVASTAEGVDACTHAWWTADGPEDDPFATDPAAPAASRDLLLSFATVIIPGHGAPFRPSRAGSRW
jgi:hypothetical protein